MAHLRISHNDLEDKLEEAKRKYEGELQKEFLWHRNNDRRTRVFFRLLGLGLTVVLVWMICRPEIPKAVQEWVNAFLELLSDVMLAKAFLLPEFIRNMAFLPRLLCGSAYSFLWLGLGFVTSILALFLGLILRICMYLIPATGPFWALMTLGKYEAPTEKERRYWFESNMAKGEMDIIQAGLEGEHAALDCVSELDDDCYVFTNLHIPYEGEQSETDMIVVSPAGITIVEVKNHKGIIRGNASDHDLVQIREGRDDPEEYEFYNPIKQVATHAYRLAGYLRSNHLRTYVRTCVLFVNPEAKLQIRGSGESKCPVFHVDQTGQLLRYLQSADTYLSDRDLSRAVNLLERLMH